MSTEQPSNAGWRQRFFAWTVANTEDAKNQLLDAHKKRLFDSLGGTVLEIGPGTGANLAYYPAGLHWIGIEPNPAMHAYLKEKAELSNLTADLRFGTAEALGVPDASVDAVVSTKVLCSVKSPVASLQEVWRVLKPGGQFIFIEHIAAPRGSAVRMIQNAITPLWKTTGGNCHPNRETWVTIEQAGFASVDYEHFNIPEPLAFITPMIAGVAVK